MHLNQLIQYFESIELSKYNNTQLLPGVKILDAELFVSSHVKVLKCQSGVRVYKPYYDRLLAFHQIIVSLSDND